MQQPVKQLRSALFMPWQHGHLADQGQAQQGSAAVMLVAVRLHHTPGGWPRCQHVSMGCGSGTCPAPCCA